MIDKHKILFILHVPPPLHGSSIIGGYINNSELINKNFDCNYINLSTSKSIDEIGKNAFAKVAVYIKILFQVFKQLLVFKPNLVYLAMTTKGIGFYKDVFIALLLKSFGKRLVLHFHNKGIVERQDKPIDHILYKWVFKKAKVILLSEYLYFDIKKYVKKEDVYYCANGIESITQEHFDTENNVVELLFLSNIIESKGVLVLLEALAILKKRKVAFHCNIVGGIGDVSEKTLIARLLELKLNAEVDYLGIRIGNEKHSVLSKADMFVHPTLNDCFPLVLLEASKYKLPMVSTIEGAIPEIIDENKTGFLVPKNNAGALAEKLEILIKDDQLRHKMGDLAFQKYQREYTLKHFEDRLDSILKSVNSTLK